MSVNSHKYNCKKDSENIYKCSSDTLKPYTCDCAAETDKGHKCICSGDSTALYRFKEDLKVKEFLNSPEAPDISNDLSEEQKAAPVSINQPMNATFKANNASARLNTTPNLEGTNITNPLLNKSLLSKANTKLNNKRLRGLNQYKGVNPLKRTKKSNKPNASRLARRDNAQKLREYLEDNSEKPRVPNQNVVEAQAMLSKLRNKSDDAALAAKEAAANLKQAKGKENLARARKEKEAADAEAKRTYIQKVNAEQAVREGTINRGSTNANILAAVEKASPASAAIEYNPVKETKEEKEARLAKQAKEFSERSRANYEAQMKRLKNAKDPAYLLAEKQNAEARRGTVSRKGGRRNKRRTLRR